MNGLNRAILFRFFLGTLFAGLSVHGFSQANAESVPFAHIPFPELGPNDTIPVPSAVHDGEWIPVDNLEWVWVSARYPKHLLKKKQEWTRLRNAVYVTYPYARKAAFVINDINRKLADMPDKSEQRKYIRSREKELKKEFADPLKELSVYQGKVLMKLINRQTGNNCYEIIKEYKGGLNAGMWQTVAFIFGSSLKQDYNPRHTDQQIELIVMELERMFSRT
ncbi:MAG TPA: DUF4294 domain-containing protein [Flavitalea sp.]|nr:DUF4294 domain-containing protein [Flavitalea sp.]